MDKKKFHASFQFASEGVRDVWKNEQNFRIHSIVALLMVVSGFLFQLSTTEWLFLLLSIFGVLSLELMNTAVERSVDLITSDYHPIAKRAKDASAAAVLIFSCGAAIIGIIIFLPKILALFFH